MSSIETRTKGKLANPGPYLAEVTNHLDPSYMGCLEVALIKGIPSVTANESETYVVRYLSPFAGNTSKRFEGTNSSDFGSVQKSYGFWMIPPDVGTTVMVIFIDGDPNQGFWIGCVADVYQNHMVPGIAASKYTAITDEQRRKYGTDLLPVGEFLKATRKVEDPNVEKFPKPIHPFADRLLQQGLLLDKIRGVTSSSARREVPSSVFGISTPGPLDERQNSKKGTIGYSQKVQVPVSRLGGSTFVMDDGDINGQNELVRIRTRTGHQILLHNSQDLVYIANSKGTAWIELTSNGKIDIFAQDSVSIHTEVDFNFRADRDINFEAGRNIHIKSGQNMETNVNGYQYLIVDGDQKISVKGLKNEAVGETVKFSVGGDFNLSVENNIVQTAGAGVSIGGEADIKIGTAGTLNFGANGNIIGSGSQIHWNGPAADAPSSADAAEAPPPLPTFSLPNRKPGAGWADGNFYKADDIKSIMQRVPTHEPWDQHENINPPKFSSQATDVTLADRSSSGVPPNPATGTQEPANQVEIVPGTCDPVRAKEINLPQCQAGIRAIKEACAKLNITNPYMVATMLGVAGGESLWKLVVENFNYTADRLLQVFPSVFKGDKELAQKYAGNPNNSLPEFLYGYDTAKGKGLGNVLPGDGLKYIGRGYIGLTGRGNYTKFSKLLYERGLVNSPTALIDNPELVNDPTLAGQIVVIYFLSHPRLKGPNQNPGPGYFEEGYRAVGYCTNDIYLKKKGYYECFLGQLQGKTVGTGTSGILTDSQGNPIKTGSGGQ